MSAPEPQQTPSQRFFENLRAISNDPGLLASAAKVEAISATLHEGETILSKLDVVEAAASGLTERRRKYFEEMRAADEALGDE